MERVRINETKIRTPSRMYSEKSPLSNRRSVSRVGRTVMSVVRRRAMQVMAISVSFNLGTDLGALPVRGNVELTQIR